MPHTVRLPEQRRFIAAWGCFLKQAKRDDHLIEFLAVVYAQWWAKWPEARGPGLAERIAAVKLVCSFLIPFFFFFLALYSCLLFHAHALTQDIRQDLEWAHLASGTMEPTLNWETLAALGKVEFLTHQVSHKFRQLPGPL